MNKYEGIILGVILGDGCLSICNSKDGKDYLITVSGHLHDDRKFLLDIIKPLFFKLFRKNTRVREQPKEGKIDLVIQSKDLLFFMNREWNLPIGKSRNKKISDKFLSNNELMKKIISGFFATDGSLVITNNNGIIYPRIEFQNVSEQMLRQVQKFLSNVSLNGGGLYKMVRENNRVVHRLQYNGKENLLKFRNVIGFINPKHEEKYLKYRLETPG